MSLIIYENELTVIKKHVAEVFPYEACGGLLGRVNGEEKEIIKAYPAKNRYGKIAWDSFEIEPDDMLEMDKISRKDNIEIIGFYHSHPNHPAVPSKFDIDASWPFYSYMILSVKGNDASDIVDIKSYIMPDKNSTPVNEKISFDK